MSPVDLARWALAIAFSVVVLACAAYCAASIACGARDMWRGQ